MAVYLLNAIEMVSRKKIAREVKMLENGHTELPKQQRKTDEDTKEMKKTELKKS